MYKILRRVCHEEKRGIQSHGGFTVFFVGSPNISNHRLGGRAEQLGVRNCFQPVSIRRGGRRFRF